MSEESIARSLGKDQLNSLEKCSATLIMYNQTEVKPLGKKRVGVINPKSNTRYSIEFIVVKEKCKSLLDLRASEQLKLLTINIKNIIAVSGKLCAIGNLTKEDITTSYTDVFRGGGTLDGELHLEIDQSAQGVQLPTRVAVALCKHKLKEKLARLTSMMIITKIILLPSGFQHWRWPQSEMGKSDCVLTHTIQYNTIIYLKSLT